MSYNYLLDLYQVLDTRLELLTDNMNDIQRGTTEFDRGRYDCLLEFKQFLRDHYHHKLPRRLQKSSKNST